MNLHDFPAFSIIIGQCYSECVIQKPLDQITKANIESLITAKVSERRTLDYKQQLPGGTDEDKRELLGDVASFANASGGDLLFGVVDERDANGKPTGIPASADGLSVTNINEQIARIEASVRDGIAPRIQGIEFVPIDGFSKGPVLIVRIPKSWAGPHMVTFKGSSRFYSRNSTGKYPLDVAEIRSAFIASTAIGEKMRAFRMDRLSNIMNGATIAPLGDHAKIVIHMVPLSSLDPTIFRDVTREAANLSAELKPIVGSPTTRRFNFDGYLLSRDNSFVQVYRSGIIESADGVSLAPWSEEERNRIANIAIEQEIISAVQRYLRAQQRLMIETPVFVMVTLIGLKGFAMGSRRRHFQVEKIDRDVLALPEISIENYGVDVARALRPAFDALWQACGFEGSQNYNAAGDWDSPRQN
ncbi:MAG TPA: ATP-binding protein [Candidatus Angelobacter sp.]|nr:ATP-binding protein [Candidatus Angelobacter sp.]